MWNFIKNIFKPTEHIATINHRIFIYWDNPDDGNWFLFTYLLFKKGTYRKCKICGDPLFIDSGKSSKVYISVIKPWLYGVDQPLQDYLRENRLLNIPKNSKIINFSEVTNESKIC